MDQETAEVNAGVRVFAKDIADQDRKDILDLMLYAQVSASKKYDKNEQSSQWMNYYQGRLIKYGCTLTAFIEPDVVVVSDLPSFREIEFKVAGASGVQPFIAHAKASFAALQISKKAMDFFRGYSGTERSITVNVSSVELAEEGAVLLLFCGIHFSSSIEVKKFFFEDEKFYDLTIHPNGGAFLFDRDKYTTHRANILRQLKEASAGIFNP